MSIQTTAMKNALATAYGAAGNATHAALYTTVPGATAGTEVTGGSPAYARKSITWTAPNTVGPLGASQPALPGVMYGQVVFDVPAGVTVAGAGVHTALTAGTYLDGGAVASQPFATQGQYTLNLSYTQS
ncbi:MAG TPA: hypothetical protein VGH54_09545 [Mycobacterium sp.]|jgi:hypothetical protein|uniref:hypothetical protein n=1 Tax=Mycobacterium sp. TaxID=1785 RepID=UPI002F418940